MTLLSVHFLIYKIKQIGQMVLKFPFSSNIVLFYVSLPFDFSSSIICIDLITHLVIQKILVMPRT